MKIFSQMYSLALLFVVGCQHGASLRQESVEDLVRDDIAEHANAILSNDINIIAGNLSSAFQSIRVADLGEQSVTSIFTKAEYIENYEKAFTETNIVSFAYSNVTIQINTEMAECIASFDYQLVYERPSGGWSDTISLYGTQTNYYRISGNTIILNRSMQNHIQVHILYEHPAAKAAFSILEFREELRGTYDGMTRMDIIEELPQEHYLLLEADTDIPDGWPQNVRHLGEYEDIRDGNRRFSISWFMTTDGDNWIHFNSFCLTTYRTKHQQEPAAIFEKRSVGEHVVVLPVMHFCFDELGKATLSSQEKSYVSRMLAYHQYKEQMVRAKHQGRPENVD